MNRIVLAATFLLGSMMATTVGAAESRSIHQLYYNSTSNAWVDQNLTAFGSGPAPGLGTSVSSLATGDGQHVYYVSNDHVQQLYYSAADNHWYNQDLTAVTGGPNTDSIPVMSSLATNDGQHVYYAADTLDEAGYHVDELFYSQAANAWVNQDLTTFTNSPRMRATGSISSFAIESDQYVYYEDVNGHLQELYYDAGTNSWSNQDVTLLTDSPLSSEGSFAAISLSDGVHIYYIASDQHLQQLFFSTAAGVWYSQDLTVATGGPLALDSSEQSSVAAFASNDGQHVYYVANDQHVQQLFYSTAANQWSSQDLTAFTGGPLASVYAPAVSGLAAADGQHVYYVDNTSHVQQLYYSAAVNRWFNQNLSAFTGGPTTSIGDGTLSSLVAGDGQHVYYVAEITIE